MALFMDLSIEVKKVMVQVFTVAMENRFLLCFRLKIYQRTKTNAVLVLFSAFGYAHKHSSV